MWCVRVVSVRVVSVRVWCVRVVYTYRAHRDFVHMLHRAIASTFLDLGIPENCYYHVITPYLLW